MSKEQENAPLGTADLVAATGPARQADLPMDGDVRREGEPTMRSTNDTQDMQQPAMQSDAELLAALFPPEMAQDFRSRWDEVQIGFVDDPKQAVRKADELVAQVMKNLAQKFADERSKFESQFDEQGSASTENLRVALRGYRSFFQHLLSL
jgi:hypothetical protein